MRPKVTFNSKITTHEFEEKNNDYTSVTQNSSAADALAGKPNSEQASFAAGSLEVAREVKTNDDWTELLALFEPAKRLQVPAIADSTHSLRVEAELPSEKERPTASKTEETSEAHGETSEEELFAWSRIAKQ